MKADRPSKPNDPSQSPADEETIGTPLAAGSVTHSSQPLGPSAASVLPSQLPAMLGRYELLKLLGRGGMGAVYLARDTQLDRSVALKVPFFTAEDGPHVLQRFLREARAAANLHHANICPVYDVGVINGIQFLTMAYIEGRSLAEVLRGSKKPIPPRQAASLVRKLALALAEAHRHQVVHRDLKPGNIMVTKKGLPIIMDFGLARRGNTQDVRLTQQGAVLGTPAYMAPEQAKGDLEEMGPSCDIYSLGVILYEVLTRRLPFTGDTFSLLAKVLTEEPPPPSQFCPDIDPALEAICLKALAKKPGDRFATMTDFAAALGDYLKTGDASQTAELPPPPAPRIRLPLWLGILAFALVAGLCLVGGGGALLYALLGGGTRQSAPSQESPVAKEEVQEKQPLDWEKDLPVAYVWPAEALHDGKIHVPDLSGLKPVLQDDFSNVASGFVDGEVPLGWRGYRNGRYVIYNKGASYQVWHIPVPPRAAAEGFACRVVGRCQEKQGRWGVRLACREGNDDRQFLFFSLVPSNGVLRIYPVPAAGPKLAEAVDVRHPAIKSGTNVFNALLLICRGRQLEVYVNDVAVCDPLLLAQPLPAQRLGLMGSCVAAEGATAEFTSVTVWPADTLPSLRKRGARPKSP